MTVWAEAREHEHATAETTDGAIEIVVDGAPRSFALVRSGDAWAAATEGIVVRGRGPLPAELVRYNGNAS